MSKILLFPNLATWSEQQRADGRRVVATNGCFDLLHVGHVRYLQAARELGDALVVGINGNDSVRALKGPQRPINPASDRAEIIAALSCVDAVVVFPDVRATEFLRAAHPAIYAKGGDYKPETLDAEERQVLESLGTEIKIIAFEKGYSTTALIGRLND